MFQSFRSFQSLLLLSLISQVLSNSAVSIINYHNCNIQIQVTLRKKPLVILNSNYCRYEPIVTQNCLKSDYDYYMINNKFTMHIYEDNYKYENIFFKEYNDKNCYNSRLCSFLDVIMCVIISTLVIIVMISSCG